MPLALSENGRRRPRRPLRLSFVWSGKNVINEGAAMTGEDERVVLETDCTEDDLRVPADLALEIGCAARTDVPVLITGGPEEGKDIACAIDRRSDRPQGTVEVVDCRERGAVGRLLAFTPRESTQAHADRAAIVLLQEVHALSPKEQAQFEHRLAEMRISPRPLVRFIASSSAPLFERVREGAFDERLYYRLNIIHMIVA
jgi:DNA-binding NtrC family response regulator